MTGGAEPEPPRDPHHIAHLVPLDLFQPERFELVQNPVGQVALFTGERRNADQILSELDRILEGGFLGHRVLRCWRRLGGRWATRRRTVSRSRSPKKVRNHHPS